MSHDGTPRSTTIARGLVALGGLNAGMHGLLGVDLVDRVLGRPPVLARAIKVAVGVATAATVATAMRGARGADQPPTSSEGPHDEVELVVDVTALEDAGAVSSPIAPAGDAGR